MIEWTGKADGDYHRVLSELAELKLRVEKAGGEMRNRTKDQLAVLRWLILGAIVWAEITWIDFVFAKLPFILALASVLIPAFVAFVLAAPMLAAEESRQNERRR